MEGAACVGLDMLVLSVFASSRRSDVPLGVRLSSISSFVDIVWICVVAAVVVVVRKEALVQVKLVQLLDEAYLKKDTPDTTEKGSQSQIKTHKRQTS